jgi:hypothetical protein
MRQKLQSVGAVLAGVLVLVLLSIGTDIVLSALGVLPTTGKQMSDGLYFLATIYRTVYAIAGGYVAARLAPDKPVRHAMILGAVGLVASTAGAAVTWNREFTVGHEWYPIALIVLSLPPAWIGGKIREMQMQPRSMAAARKR